MDPSAVRKDMLFESFPTNGYPACSIRSRNLETESLRLAFPTSLYGWWSGRRASDLDGALLSRISMQPWDSDNPPRPLKTFVTFAPRSAATIDANSPARPPPMIMICVKNDSPILGLLRANRGKCGGRIPFVGVCFPRQQVLFPASAHIESCGDRLKRGVVMSVQK